MSATWPTVALAEVLSPAVRERQVDPSAEYPLLGVRLAGQGPFHRETVLGTQTSAARLYEVKAGDFIYSRLFAWRGAFGLIEPELDGHFVSNEFPTFTPIDERIDPKYLRYWFRLPDVLRRVEADCSGSTPLTRNRYKEQYFFALKIPLPPLDEQRRIVSRIEELAAKVGEARGLRTQAMKEVDAVRASAANDLFSDTNMKGVPVIELEHIAEIRAGVTLGRKLIGETIRLPYLRVANVQDGRLDLRVLKEVEIYPDERQKWSLCRGDLLLTEGGDWDKLGRGTVWQDEVPDCIHQNHIFRVRVDQTRFDPWYVSALMSSPRGKEFFQAASKQTTNLASINQRQLKSFPIFALSLGRQRAILTELETLQAKVQAVESMQTETAAELDAMLPAILDKAFKGEL